MSKNLLKIIKRVIGENPREWHFHLTHALWAYRTTTKSAHGETPFYLVYGKEAIMHTELEILTYRLAFQTKELDTNSLTQCFNAILALDEQCEIANGHTKKRQWIIKKIHEKKDKAHDFQVVQQVLLWDSAHE